MTFRLPCIPKFLRIIALFVGLTLLTQVGGVIWFCIRKVGPRFSDRRKIQLAINLLVYVMVTLTIVPVLARIGGRVALPVFATDKTPVAPRSFIFVITNRNYVKTEVRDVLFSAARKLRENYPKSVVHYLDGGFPFFDRFAMLPHLSHNRGEAVDIAFCYHSKKDSSKHRKSPSPIGYFLYEGPKKNEYQPYSSKHSWLRWNFSLLQWLNRTRTLDRDRTRLLLRYLLEDPRTTKVLLEAHLHHRWGITHRKLRFQQLQAARHDDHAHIWVKQR